MEANRYKAMTCWYLNNMNLIHVSFVGNYFCDVIPCGMYVFIWEVFFEISNTGPHTVKFIHSCGFITAPAADQIKLFLLFALFSNEECPLNVAMQNLTN